MTPTLRHRARVLKTIFPDVYREVDGYWVWGPQGMIGGWNEWDLEVAADLLREANRKWDREIKEYFERQRREDGG